MAVSKFVLRVTEVAPRVCGANGKATPPSTGWPGKFATIHPRLVVPETYTTWSERAGGRGADADVLSVLEKFGEFRVDFSSVKV